MPRVPTYDQGQAVMPSAPGAQTISTPDVSSGSRALSAGLAQVSDAAYRYAERDAQTQAWQAQAQINKDFLDWDTQRRKQAQGANANGYTADVDKWWNDAREKYAGALSPMAQQMIGKQLAVSKQTALESAAQYQDQQLEIGERSALEASTTSLLGQAVAAGPAKANAYLDQVKANLTTWGAKKGIDPAPAILKATTGAHVTLINQMMQNDPKGAEVYFNTNKDAIDPLQWDNITEKLNRVSAVKDGNDSADAVWRDKVKGGYNTPVDMFGMERELRDKFKDDPVRQGAAIQALRERKTAWDASQAEFNASNTNAVYRMLNGGISLQRIKQTPQWQDLPDEDQDQIMYQQEQRGLAREQSRDRMLLRQNADKYLDYTNPVKLASMSRPQVQALHSTFGFEAALHLLDRYDSFVKNPADLTEAKMDEDSFKRIASDFGINAYDPRGDEKKQVGDLKFRVERVIAMEQEKRGRKLTETEKEDVVRKEMATKVEVNPGWWRPNKNVRVPLLTADQAADVVVPNEAKHQLKAEMLKLYRVNGNPAYSDTDDNLRAYYLRKKSAASTLIPKKQDE